MMSENDSILVFEYFTASGEKDKCIISEAEELIFALLDDLKEYNVDLVINESYENAVKEYAKVNPILIDGLLRPFGEAIASERKHPLTMRRYMWKLSY